MSDQLGLLPHSRQEFASRAYWDDFFVQWKKNGGADAKSFEWYGAWSDIFPVIQLHSITTVSAAPRVLVVGCGNSDLSERMYDSGFKDVTSIDFSQIVIDEMKAKTQSKPGLEFLLMDMLNLETSWTDSFDLVVDKGALDALMGDDDTASADNAAKMIGEIGRVLRKGGRYLVSNRTHKHSAKENTSKNNAPTDVLWEFY
jgi:SAM-dependent methyltransferase